MSSDEELIARINQRRKQVLVHSVLYYRMDKSIISDKQWDIWARELDALQKAHPELMEKCWRNDIFKDFDPCSGYYLPLYDSWALSTAMWLYQYHNNRKQTNGE